MELRKWKYEDIMSIAALEKQCFSDPWSFRMLADTFFGENVITAVAEEEGQLADYGFAVLAGEDADIANVAVAPAFRRRGIARQILESLEKRAASAGVGRIFLEVRVSNAPAMALYLKCGYVGRYVRPRYYGDGEDALIMEKQLGTDRQPPLP